MRKTGLMVVVSGFRNMSIKKSPADALTESFKKLRMDTKVSSKLVHPVGECLSIASCTLVGCSARNEEFPVGNDKCFARNDDCSARNDECFAGFAAFGNVEVGSLQFLEPDGLPHGFSRRNYFRLAPVLHPGL